LSGLQHGLPAGAARRRAPWLAAAAALAVAACESPAAPILAVAYEFALPLDEPLVYRWAVGADVRVLVDGGPDEKADLLLAALTDAAADWERALGPGLVRFRPVAEGDAEVLLRWSDSSSPVVLSECAPRVTGRAATTFCRTADGRGLEPFPRSDGSVTRTPIRMVVTILSEESGARRVRQLVAHELGHVLGIGRHSGHPLDLMWEGRLSADGPGPADIATVRRLYRTPPDIRL